MPTRLGPKGDMRCRGVLSGIVNLPEMHIPPWYWFSWIEGSEADDFFDDMKNANGAGLQEVVSVRLLTFCENWFLRPAIWHKYGEKRRQAMTEAFNNFESLVDGRYERTESLSTAKWQERWGIANRHQLNLFRY